MIELDEAFAVEFRALEPVAQVELLALAKLLADYGPQLGRPYADTLKGSKHANMTELRFAASGVAWRVAFAFDPERKAILLVAGDKSGGSERRFYRQLIAKADARFDAHLQRLTAVKKGKVRWAGASTTRSPICRASSRSASMRATGS